MRKVPSYFTILLLSVMPAFVWGTTWVPVKVRDPVGGGLIEVQQPASWGSYIYEQPGKSDQVFWPYTYDVWLWFNPKSGYIAFGDDFEKVDASKKAALKVWLKTNFDRKRLPVSRLELLSWAEKVYSVRGMDDDFWCYYYRLMAYENRANQPVSLDYVRKALPLLLAKLESAKEPSLIMETLYLLSEYNRRLGTNSDSDAYLARLQSFETEDDLSEFKTYLLNIAKEQRDPPPNISSERP